MKKIEQYFKELLEQHPYKQVGNRDSYSEYNEGWQDALDLAMQVAKQIQIEAIEETCKVCAENADADVCFLGELAAEQINSSEPFIEGQDYEVYVLKQSILNCAEILKREIE